MLDVLYQAESELPTLLCNRSGWQSLHINYEQPVVERLWQPYGDGYRVMQHRTYFCQQGKSFWHRHGSPMAVKKLAGIEEVSFGHSDSDSPPQEITTVLLRAGDVYEMTDPDLWHCIRPLTPTTLSTMVSGQPWSKSGPKSPKPLHPLSTEVEGVMFKLFQSHYAL